MTPIQISLFVDHICTHIRFLCRVPCVENTNFWMLIVRIILHIHFRALSVRHSIYIKV